jgi:hypothetical protein
MAGAQPKRKGKHMKRLLVVGALALFAASAQAQETESWADRFNRIQRETDEDQMKMRLDDLQRQADDHRLHIQLCDGNPRCVNDMDRY